MVTFSNQFEYFMNAMKEPTIDAMSVSRRESKNDLLSEITVEQKNLMEMFYRLECSVSHAHMKDVQKGNWNIQGNIPLTQLVKLKLWSPESN